MISESLEAAQTLKNEGFSVRLVHFGTVKPIDVEAVVTSAKQTKGIVTVEEHSIIGGLGEAVAGVVSENHPCPVQRIGVKDVFGESGMAPELMDKYGLRAKNIVEAAKIIL